MKTNSPLGFRMPHSPLNQDYDPNYAGDTDKLLEEVKREAGNPAPEYDPPTDPKKDPNYKFFITNRSNESDKVAKTIDSLKYHVKFDKNKKPNLQMQKDLLKKYNLKYRTNKISFTHFIHTKTPYIFAYQMLHSHCV